MAEYLVPLGGEGCAVIGKGNAIVTKMLLEHLNVIRAKGDMAAFDRIDMPPVSGCGLRPIRCLLHFITLERDLASAAVCGQFAVCYTLASEGFGGGPAAVCGQFAVCYTEISLMLLIKLGCGLRPIRCLLHFS